jgi:predicted dehydrogenase
MTSLNEPFRWGILGTGRMASAFADELLLHPKAKLVAVASSHPNRAAVFAKQKGLHLAFDSYEELIDCDEVDVVYIATTNESHFVTAMQCIEHQKPVVVEKPICTEAADLEMLIRAATKRRVFCMEAVWMLFFPAVLCIRDIIAPIGPVTRLDASFCIHVPYDPHHRLYDPLLGGGAMLDIGIYPFTFAHRLLGLENARIEHRLSFAPTGTDDAGEIVLTYPNDVVAYLSYSLRAARPHTAIIEGQNGRAVFEDFFHPSAVTVTASRLGEMRTTYTYPLKGYHFEIDAVHAALKANAKECDIAPLQDSLTVLSAMKNILKDTPK